ncbi:MAG: hypothetical protein L6R48_07735 [Planctomycetes bacterium]|nr:hypothetical protein [Planctomycetota bacterium]
MNREERLHRRTALVAEVMADLQVGLSAEDRDLIVRYMVMRALGQLGLAPASEPLLPPSSRRRRPSRRRPTLRKNHAR